MRLFCIGHGFVARTLAEQLGARADATGTARAPETDRIGPARLVAFASQAALDAARTATHVLVSTPPGEEGCPAHARFAEILEDALKLEWIGYLSTTGVYGDRRGGWAFEDDLATPRTARARRRVMAENAWLGMRVAACVFRLPGIYGPGRSALDRAREGAARRIDAPDIVFNRAHVADIAAALGASMARPTPGTVFNVADNFPCPQEQVILEACRLLGVKPPKAKTIDQSDLSEMGREFYSESKRVSNARAKAVLGWRPRYPSYREGLAAVYEAEAAST